MTIEKLLPLNSTLPIQNSAVHQHRQTEEYSKTQEEAERKRTGALCTARPLILKTAHNLTHMSPPLSFP